MRSFTNSYKNINKSRNPNESNQTFVNNNIETNNYSKSQKTSPVKIINNYVIYNNGRRVISMKKLDFSSIKYEPYKLPNQVLELEEVSDSKNSIKAKEEVKESNSNRYMVKNGSSKLISITKVNNIENMFHKIRVNQNVNEIYKKIKPPLVKNTSTAVNFNLTTKSNEKFNRTVKGVKFNMNESNYFKFNNMSTVINQAVEKNQKNKTKQVHSTIKEEMNNTIKTPINIYVSINQLNINQSPNLIEKSMHDLKHNPKYINILMIIFSNYKKTLSSEFMNYLKFVKEKDTKAKVNFSSTKYGTVNKEINKSINNLVLPKFQNKFN